MLGKGTAPRLRHCDRKDRGMTWTGYEPSDFAGAAHFHCRLKSQPPP
jgi:hypothetical protein